MSESPPGIATPSASFLAKFAQPPDSRAEGGKRYTASPELSQLLGCDHFADIKHSEEQLLKLLLESGAISEVSESNAQAKNRWQRALGPALKRGANDRWGQYNIPSRPTELCVRWDFDTIKHSWKSTETMCKMEVGPPDTPHANAPQVFVPSYMLRLPSKAPTHTSPRRTSRLPRERCASAFG